MSLFALVVGLAGYRYLHLLSDLLVGAGVSAFRHDTPAKPRVARVPKARTEPWVNTDKSGLSSVGAALSVRAFVLCRCCLWLCIRWESAAPLGLNKSV